MTELEEIRRRVSLVDLALEAGAQLVDHRNSFTSICPLPNHAGDRNNSRAFNIYENGQKWKCFTACPSGLNQGDIFSFYMAWHGVDFQTAAYELAKRAGVNLQNQRMKNNERLPARLNQKADPLNVDDQQVSQREEWVKRALSFIHWSEEILYSIEGDGARAYLEQERGLIEETWHAFHLGFCSKNFFDEPGRWGLDGKRIWLPRGIVIPGFRKEHPYYIKIRRPLPGHSLERYIGPLQKDDLLNNAKFGGPRGGKSTMFGMDLASRHRTLVLTEGEWDAMLLWQHCRDICDVGTLGGAQTHFQFSDLVTLTAYFKIVVVHDKDNAGDAGRDYIRQLSSNTPRLLTALPPAHDLSDFWRSGGNLREWVMDILRL